MLYTFEAGGDGELTVPEGREVVVVEPDCKYISYPSVYALRREGSRVLTYYNHSRDRLDQGPRRIQGRPRASELRRVVTIDAHCAAAYRAVRPAAVSILQQRLLDRRGQEEGPRGRAQEGREEAQVRRGAVRLRGAERRRAQHDGGREVRPD